MSVPHLGADICHQMPGPYLNADIYLPGPYLGADICLETSWCRHLPGGKLPGPHFKADICLEHILARHLPRPHFSADICLNPALVCTFAWTPFQCRHLPGGYLAWTTSWCGHLSGGHLLGPSWCGHLPGPKPGADIYLLDICLDPLGEDICLDPILVRTFAWTKSWCGHLSIQAFVHRLRCICPLVQLFANRFL